jgi:intergrase/recombinase
VTAITNARSYKTHLYEGAHRYAHTSTYITVHFRARSCLRLNQILKTLKKLDGHNNNNNNNNNNNLTAIGL